MLEEVLNSLQELQGIKLSQRADSDRMRIEEWLQSTVNSLQPVFLMRPDHRTTVSNSITSDEVIRDFMLDLGFTFYATLGITDGVARLAANIIEGLLLDGPDTELNELPDAMKTAMTLACFRDMVVPQKWWRRLFRKEDTTLLAYLASNRLLLLVYVLNLSNGIIKRVPQEQA